MKRIALIGSRETPKEIYPLIHAMGKWFSGKGIISYSGGAPGPDEEFLRFYNKAYTRVIIPYNGFNNHDTSQEGVFLWDDLSNQAKIKSIIKARSVTSYYSGCKPIVQKLFSRNAMQILGLECTDPVDAVFFYAPESKFGKVSGGTRVAVEIARNHGIPTYNLLNQNVYDRFAQKLLGAPSLDHLFSDS
ncbi:hypothetical protein CPT_Muldoon_179 [Serratia phage Muldoon]|uniref:DNA recombination-mediator protein A n=1 Tax=Serratia phage Muldoon TaxID=2601678 RepID=A0A5P8PJ93_9CAUD|nr:DprA-like DNA recombination-mediator protein [Serratia phage Muldoon]QFR56130.1 hypothetical protein CPT_Muldoon_179 [Serratia phage Muldoon]